MDAKMKEHARSIRDDRQKVLQEQLEPALALLAELNDLGSKGGRTVSWQIVQSPHDDERYALRFMGTAGVNPKDKYAYVAPQDESELVYGYTYEVADRVKVAIQVAYQAKHIWKQR